MIKSPSIHKVSILIPVYNRESLIAETLNSAIKQTYSNTEIIVVDNNSTDGTFNILKKFSKKYSKVKIFRNKENMGPVKNWRKCIKHATGEYAKILWSDDLIDEKFIEKTLPYLVDNRDIGFVFTGTEIFNEKTKNKAYFIGKKGVYDSNVFIQGSLLGGDFPVSPGNAIFRLKDLKKNLIINIPNKFNIDFKFHGAGNDLLLFLLTAIDYPKFAYIDEVLAYFRAHKDSITVSGNKIENSLGYNVSKSYFVENYINEKKIIRKFNSMLLIMNLKGILIGKSGISFIRNFYFKNDYGGFDFRFFIILLVKKVVKKILSILIRT